MEVLVKPNNPPDTTYAFGYRKPPVSGNRVNGHGEEVFRRATPVFHNGTGETIPWQALDDFFSMINPWSVVRHMLANTWQLRRQDGPHASEKTSAEPHDMAARMKERARALGADIVGITEVTEQALYEGMTAPYPNAICIGQRMDREEMRHVPQERAAVEVMRTYRTVSRIAIELAETIRAMGWPAKAYGNPNSTEILHIPLAVAAGLGELGKHGSLISEEFGSNVRLAAVLTDLPMSFDAPRDLGVEDVCLNCRRCVIDCPPDAIHEEKQWVRGQRKWYVDFDACVPYFVKTFGCAICIEVCPWSEPGRGPAISQRVLAKRQSSRPQ